MEHPWKVRSTVGLLMLVLAFVGIILTDIKHDGAWDYWRCLVPFYAVLSLSLSAFLRKGKHLVTPFTIWQEFLHWAGLFLAVYLVSVLVNMGIFGRFVASLQVLTLLALTTYINGIYIEPTFIPIGILLGGFVAGIALLEVYLYVLMIPLTLTVGGLIGWIAYRKR